MEAPRQEYTKGDESRRLSSAAVVDENRRTAVGGAGEAGVAGVAAQQAALVALSDLRRAEVTGA